MPYPWKLKPKTLPRVITEDQIPDILESAKQKVLKWAQSKVGFLGRGIEMLSNSPDKRAAAISNLREEKLSKALTAEVNEPSDRSSLKLFFHCYDRSESVKKSGQIMMISVWRC